MNWIDFTPCNRWNQNHLHTQMGAVWFCGHDEEVFMIEALTLLLDKMSSLTKNSVFGNQYLNCPHWIYHARLPHKWKWVDHRAWNEWNSIAFADRLFYLASWLVLVFIQLSIIDRSNAKRKYYSQIQRLRTLKVTNEKRICDKNIHMDYYYCTFRFHRSLAHAQAHTQLIDAWIWFQFNCVTNLKIKTCKRKKKISRYSSWHYFWDPVRLSLSRFAIFLIFFFVVKGNLVVSYVAWSMIAYIQPFSNKYSPQNWMGCSGRIVLQILDRISTQYNLLNFFSALKITATCVLMDNICTGEHSDNHSSFATRRILYLKKEKIGDDPTMTYLH